MSMLEIKRPSSLALQSWYKVGMTFVVPGSGFDRFGVEEWPCVERASSASVTGCEDDEAATIPLCGADGSLLASGSGGGGACPAEEGADELADVLIGSGDSGSLRFLLAELKLGVTPGCCCPVPTGANWEAAVGGIAVWAVLRACIHVLRCSFRRRTLRVVFPCQVYTNGWACACGSTERGRIEMWGS